MQHLVFSLGSNLGDRKANLQAAMQQLEKFGKWEVKSSVYESAPYGFNSVNAFYNMCGVLKANAPAIHWKQEILRIEENLGRIRTGQYADRTIDIDLLFVWPRIDIAGMNVPHPEMHKRDFVVQPLYEIRSVLHSQWNKRVEEMYTLLPGKKTAVNIGAL